MDVEPSVVEIRVQLRHSNVVAYHTYVQMLSEAVHLLMDITSSYSAFVTNTDPYFQKPRDSGWPKGEKRAWIPRAVVGCGEIRVAEAKRRAAPYRHALEPDL